MNLAKIILACGVLLGSTSFAQNAPAPTTPPPAGVPGPDGEHHHHKWHHCMHEQLAANTPPVNFKTATKEQKEAARVACEQKLHGEAPAN